MHRLQSKFDIATIWNGYRLKDDDFTECIRAAADAAGYTIRKMNQERLNGQKSSWQSAVLSWCSFTTIFLGQDH